MVNLLPSGAREHITLEYRLRLTSVALFTLAFALIVGAALLLPSYFLAWVTRTSLDDQSAITQETLSQPTLAKASQDEKATASIFSSVRQQLDYPEPTVILSDLFSNTSRGISVRYLNYGPVALTGSTAMLTINISGVADTRDDLLAFKDELTNAPGVSAVNLPIDSLAASQNIDFALTVSWSPPSASSK
ncbi:MAG: hypothetical protein KGJ34_01335 [Patescibacteria group bacterium]|nr:hypothetical protein [Patescibacteria group bacterium]